MYTYDNSIIQYRSLPGLMYNLVSLGVSWLHPCVICTVMKTCGVIISNRTAASRTASQLRCSHRRSCLSIPTAAATAAAQLPTAAIWREALWIGGGGIGFVDDTFLLLLVLEPIRNLCFSSVALLFGKCGGVWADFERVQKWLLRNRKLILDVFLNTDHHTALCLEMRKKYQEISLVILHTHMNAHTHSFPLPLVFRDREASILKSDLSFLVFLRQREEFHRLLLQNAPCKFPLPDKSPQNRQSGT